MSTSSPLQRTVAMLMAGGVGNRLYPLTRDRAKPAVPFGALYRIIDFTLSNCLNSGVFRINVLTQYRSFSLHRHVREAWGPLFNLIRGEYVELIPPQQRVVGDWYRGTADAIFQNIYLLEQERPEFVLILSGDHIYRMDYGQMLQAHIDQGAALTIACMEVPIAEATRLGVMTVNEADRIIGFDEKPAHPKPVPGNPDIALASMGVYIFNTRDLVRMLSDDARTDSAHDFGKNIIPTMVQREMPVQAFRFRDPLTNETGYWRDIGTLDSYFDANMDLLQVVPPFNLYDPDWPIHTRIWSAPPARTVHAVEETRRIGMAVESLLAPGCIVSGGRVQRSLLSPHVRVNSFSEVTDSILFGNVDIGRHATIRRAIVDKHVRVPEGYQIGVDPEHDRRRFTVTETGIVVVPKGMVLD
ncbi:MAG: glucose-1-phosphate adenylyltransferase [Fimbriimonadaceae bacterium]|nr:glucose-1-phosphate adenylyltransferase [Fimbriimonadaceae bacterium]